jgi:hypothetical protein
VLLWAWEFSTRQFFRGVDYFDVPMMPDAFSVQGIENFGVVYG